MKRPRIGAPLKRPPSMRVAEGLKACRVSDQLYGYVEQEITAEI